MTIFARQNSLCCCRVLWGVGRFLTSIPPARSSGTRHRKSYYKPNTNTMNKKKLFILAAGSMLLLSACEKQGQSFFRIDGDRITFDVTMDGATAADKQAYNGPAQRIFFTSGDQVYINGAICDVNPIAAAAIPGSSSTFSPLAQMTASLSDNGTYEFVYPAAAVTKDGDSYTAHFPNDVRAMSNIQSYNAFDATDDMGFSAPVWPMYFKTQDLDSQNGIILKNTCSFIGFRVTLGADYFNRIFHDYYEYFGDPNFDTTFTAAPTIEPSSISLIGSGIRLAGDAQLDCSDTDAPVMVMSENLSQNDTLLIRLPADSSAQSNAQIVSRDLGIITIAPAPNNIQKSFALEFTYYIRHSNGELSVLTHIFRGNSTTAPIERNHLYYMNIGLADLPKTITGTSTGDNMVKGSASGDEAILKYVDQNGNACTVKVVTNKK